MVAVNFLPWRQLLRRRRWQQHRLYLGGPLACCLLFSGGTAWRSQVQSLLDSGVQHQWQQESGTLQKRLQVIAQQKAQRDALFVRWQQKQAERQRATRWNQWLSLLAVSLPSSMWLSEIVWQAPYLRVVGLTLQQDDLARWQEVLSDNPSFSQVLLRQLVQQDGTSLKFVLQLTTADEDV